MGLKLQCEVSEPEIRAMGLLLWTNTTQRILIQAYTNLC
jgi:hypothetical protein